MRFTPVLLVTIVALFLSPQAQAQKTPNNGAIFGTASCKPTFPCADTSSTESLRLVEDQIINIAERCIASKLGLYRSTSGYIERSFGLSPSLCLTSKTLPREADGLTITPECCVKPVEGSPNVCQLICTKYGVK